MSALKEKRKSVLSALPAEYDVPERMYTTGQVAQICKVADRTVCVWCNKGILPHIRIPGSQDRRIYEGDLIRFLIEHRFRLPLALLPYAVVTIGLPPGADVPGAVAFTDAMEFGRRVPTIRVRAAVVGDANGLSEARRVCEFLHKWHPLARVYLVVSEAEGEVTQPNCVVLSGPCDWPALVAEIAGGAP